MRLRLIRQGNKWRGNPAVAAGANRYGEAENHFSYDNTQSSKSVTSRNKLDWREERSNNVGRLYLGQITFLEQKERSASRRRQNELKKLTFKWSFSYLTNSVLL